MCEIFFLTGNEYKFKEAKKVLKKYDIVLHQEKGIDALEIQSIDIGEVAKFAALSASKELNKPVIKVDCGFFIEKLNGFPGAYTSDINKMIGCKGILKLLEDAEDRSALWKDALAFADPSGFFKIFFSETSFKVAKRPQGEGKWSLDSIMIPEGSDKTFAQMEFDERLKHWKTTIFNQLGEFLRNEYNK